MPSPPKWRVMHGRSHACGQRLTGQIGQAAAGHHGRHLLPMRNNTGGRLARQSGSVRFGGVSLLHHAERRTNHMRPCPQRCRNVTPPRGNGWTIHRAKASGLIHRMKAKRFSFMGKCRLLIMKLNGTG